MKEKCEIAKSLIHKRVNLFINTKYILQGIFFTLEDKVSLIEQVSDGDYKKASDLTDPIKEATKISVIEEVENG